LGKDLPFDRFRREQKINMILVTDALLNDTRFRDDPEWKAFLDNYESVGFVKLIVRGTNSTLYVGETILPGPTRQTK
jgi:hypothetical protein